MLPKSKRQKGEEKKLEERILMKEKIKRKKIIEVVIEEESRGGNDKLEKETILNAFVISKFLVFPMSIFEKTCFYFLNLSKNTTLILK